MAEGKKCGFCFEEISENQEVCSCGKTVKKINPPPPKSGEEYQKIKCQQPALLDIFAGQEAGNLGSTGRANAAGHRAALGSLLNLAVFDLLLFAALNAITFKIHDSSSFQKLMDYPKIHR